MKIHSHYDNLKVSRDAPQEVIRAAYKTLSQKYHPDRRIDDPDAERVMKIINASYAVLSDPVQRKEHDEWLARKEREAAAAAALQRSPRQPAPASQRTNWQSAAAQSRREVPPRSSTWTSQAHIDPRAAKRKPRAASGFSLRKISLRSWTVIGVCAFFGYVAISESTTPWPFTRNTTSYGSPYGTRSHAGPDDATSPDGKRRGLAAMSSAQAATSPWSGDGAVASSDPSVSHALFVRPTLAPNGVPWPSKPSYLDGMPVGAAGGHSSVTVDNSVNRFDVFGKLVYNASVFDQPVRHFFVPAGKTFTLIGVAPGAYDVRYQNLDDGGLYKSQGFELSEQAVGNSVDATNVSITLYALPGSTVKPTTIGRGDF
ncbi:J domain-containing protein [Paraburkholderia caribensis]|uniref:J domain-containing protein n=1 Tax=Paraburkholderia caribensis TaxID=75105 RepID=UPI000722F06E|nr:J domain-containing protein [Paraburkholderia caribensis]ALP66397.1 molecular chaperone DnaJ [Paraburkholderia caribensis]AUT54670.1 J domain-containing protein [Paraburkholderia caribensis]